MKMCSTANRNGNGSRHMGMGIKNSFLQCRPLCPIKNAVYTCVCVDGKTSGAGRKLGLLWSSPPFLPLPSSSLLPPFFFPPSPSPSFSSFLSYPLPFSPFPVPPFPLPFPCIPPLPLELGPLYSS